MNKDKNEIEELMELKNKLTNGMVFKSYRALCKHMKWESTGGSVKVANIKKLNAICTYHKQGNSIVIDEVFDTPLPIKGRGGKQPSNFPQFKVDEDKWHNKGVYMIKLDNQIYIGSTVNFRGRFMQHLRGDLDYMKHTYELLNNGGEFFILHDMNDIEDIELIRQIEEEYILFYTHETDYDVINRRMGASASKKSKKPKIKYKTIKIEENRLSEVLEILEERGVCYKYK